MSPTVTDTYDAMLVLGARLSAAGEPLPTLKARLNTAAQAYQRGLAPHVILCGGYDTRGHNEADAMLAYLLERGIPAGALHRERQSVTTRGNLQQARSLLLALGAQTLLVVTNGFHAPRVRYHARQLGLCVTVLAAHAPLRIATLHAIAREAAACAVTLYRHPMRLGQFRPGRYHRQVELCEGILPMHASIMRSALTDPELLAPGVTRKTLSRTESLTVCEVQLLRGAQLAEHSHDCAQVLYVVSGAVTVRTPDGDASLTAGDSVCFPPGAPHALTATAEGTVLTDTRVEPWTPSHT